MLPGLLLLSLLATSALAQEPDARPVPEIGEDTRHWLELQRSGRQATAASDRLSPGAAREAERRMVESFGHPVPEYFVDKAFSDE
ncbi:DUF3613 domain-containing protein [Marinobacterium nitratireducens]|uniref:DUF3613 domain-containing protein n=1 Tax=Marinobacterium nitratireducens TaxID=518897 RepID=UPI001E47C076|nr:DUF3613 domain-containing protein [Marinobacterium nitratireducens]